MSVGSIVQFWAGAAEAVPELADMANLWAAEQAWSYHVKLSK